MKAALAALAVLVMVSGDHVTVRLAGHPAAVPVPVFGIAAELAACAVLLWLIRRAARPLRLYPYRPWRLA